LRLPEVFARGDWVVHCQYAGSGAPALKYLARYLYRGVTSLTVGVFDFAGAGLF
jgi:hypothetical protein